jgi:esterase/lipase
MNIWHIAKAGFINHLCTGMLLLLLTACSGGPDQPFALASASNNAQPSIDRLPAHKLPVFDGNFATYREQTREFLRRHSMPQRSEADITLNLPFEIKASKDVPYRGKFLLLHGLNDSPYVWTDIAPELVKRGFDVRAPLFQGHGSTPKAMLDVSYRDWMRTARNHYHSWKDSDTPVYVGGFSMGAVIATLLAIENNQRADSEVAGLLLISPAFHSRLNSYLRWSGLYATFKPWVFGGMILEDNPIKYNSIPVNSGWQFYKTTRLLKRKLRGTVLDIPTVMINSANDSVVDTDVVRTLYRKHFAPDESILLTYHEAPVPESTATEQYRLSTIEGTRLLNQSHLGLMYNSANPLFGSNGKILVCNGNEYPIFIACMRARNHWFGAQHTPSPDGVPVARITYNPDFQTLLQLLDRVLLQTNL